MVAIKREFLSRNRGGTSFFNKEGGGVEGRVFFSTRLILER